MKPSRKQIEAIKNEADEKGEYHQFGWDYDNSDISAIAAFALKTLDLLSDIKANYDSEIGISGRMWDQIDDALNMIETGSTDET